jgi:excisionase family DNA binding protein
MSELGDLIKELSFSLKSRFFPVSESQVLMTPAEVASLFRVDPKTVTRWADAGKLTAVRTLGGHRRYRQDEVQNLLVASSISSSVVTESAAI